MFKVLNNNVIIKKSLIKKQNSNIFIKQNEVNNIGIVINAEEKSVIKENDIVIFDENKAQEFKYNNEKYLFINEKDIIAIIE